MTVETIVSIPIGKSGPFSRSTETRLLRKSYRFQSPSGSQALLAGVTITRGVITGVAFQSPSGSQALLAPADSSGSSQLARVSIPIGKSGPFSLLTRGLEAVGGEEFQSPS